jgi:hypothetical protein
MYIPYTCHLSYIYDTFRISCTLWYDNSGKPFYNLKNSHNAGFSKTPSSAVSERSILSEIL